MSSAPEHADLVSGLSERLSPDQRNELAYRWMDRCVRVHAAAAIERVGYPRQAEQLRNLSEIRGRPDWADARDVLCSTTAAIPAYSAETMDVLACLFGLITVEDHLSEEGAEFRWVIISTVTAARCAGVWSEERDQIADVKALLR